MRTAQTIAEQQEVSHSSDRSTKRRTQTNPNSLRNLKPFVKGQSGNPGGKPKNDLAKEIAQAIFENDADAIYRAYAKALRAGNAYAFTVLADRAFGKLKEVKELTGTDGAPLDVKVRFVDTREAE
jgi:hypothetical protein